jgi:uncharacterized protein YcaQ
MQKIPAAFLSNIRAQTFHISKAIKSPDEALEWVNERGFIHFWPIKGIVLPNLWTAVAGDRPVADEHDDPGHVTWGWKDQSLGKRQWYYAKILRRKATIISKSMAPYFYALSENYGAPEEDHLLAYEEGRLTLAAKLVYEALLKEGALNTIDLRRAARLASKAGDTEFNRALEFLQADFKILPVGVSNAGAWHYAHLYDVTARHWPELPEKARKIGEAQARAKLLECYLRSVGAARAGDVHKLFGWPSSVVDRIVARQIEKRKMMRVEVESQKGEWLTLRELLK